MGSMQWTDEEANYLKAIFTWQEIHGDDRISDRTSRLSQFEAQNRRSTNVKSEGKTESDFRVLIVGTKGCGKTSVLTRFALDAFEVGPGSPQGKLEGGCRQSIQIDGLNYNVDVLELPSKHLTTNLMLEQALAITEGAVLLYDITDQASLELAIRVQRFMSGSFRSSNSNNHGISRQYGLLLVGNKSDVDDEERVVAWAEGSKTASTFDTGCPFLEISARTGDKYV
ncbi:uncharacterized protein PgNI_03343 [Pyricularia grisea]|uniref:small monomeric GTPase n=1 Tax=Pyricularia grisea TaxID=148305 RepID=A0A6P8BCN5_PYRGI|nr:uncharacterized protein PgNI_03343 [Pyricularia grisea]TLD13580.1 hypothetical protein PgNI_03343 [Pyricularia grisea]